MASHDLTQGSVTKTMLRFAVPMICGNLLQQFYNVADTLIVGRYLGSDALAAVGWGCAWEAARSFPCATGREIWSGCGLTGLFRFF